MFLSLRVKRCQAEGQGGECLPHGEVLEGVEGRGEEVL